MKWRGSIARDCDVTELLFFLCLCFHMLVADNASVLMCAQELPYMTFNDCKLCTLVISFCYYRGMQKEWRLCHFWFFPRIHCSLNTIVYSFMWCSCITLPLVWTSASLTCDINCGMSKVFKVHMTLTVKLWRCPKYMWHPKFHMTSAVELWKHPKFNLCIACLELLIILFYF